MDKPVNHFSASVLTRYGVGQVGAQVFRDTPAVLLPVFMTTLLGVPAWLAGAAILAPKLWIVIADPLMGSWSDRRKSTWGRLPFLAVGALVTMFGFFLLFTPPRFQQPAASALYISLIYLLASTGFSAYTVPYLALASELGGDSKERTRIMSYRVVFTIVGVVLGVGVAQPAVIWFGGGSAGWSHMALAMALVCVLAMLVPVVGLGGGRSSPQKASPAPYSPSCGTWEAIAVLHSARHLSASGDRAGHQLFGGGPRFPFCFQERHASDSVRPFDGVRHRGLPAVLALVRWEVRQAERLFPLCLGVDGPNGQLVFRWIGWPGRRHFTVRRPVTQQHLLVLVRALFIGFFNTGFILMGLSMLADTIVFDRVRFGRSSEGVFSGLFSAVEKVSFAIGPAIGGILLSLSGFVSSKGGAMAQAPQAIRGILLNYSLIPIHNIRCKPLYTAII